MRKNVRRNEEEKNENEKITDKCIGSSHGCFSGSMWFFCIHRDNSAGNRDCSRKHCAETAAAETDEAASTEAESTDTAAFDLAGKKIGVQLGTTGDQLATEYEQNDGSTVERFNKGADAIQALKQGKIDCVVIDYNPAKAFVEKNDDLQILDEELSSEEYAMCVNKDNSELTAKINEALTQLKEDGTLDANRFQLHR